jgi:hypothetical protein
MHALREYAVGLKARRHCDPLAPRNGRESQSGRHTPFTAPGNFTKTT